MVQPVAGALSGAVRGSGVRVLYIGGRLSVFSAQEVERLEQEEDRGDFGRVEARGFWRPKGQLGFGAQDQRREQGVEVRVVIFVRFSL